MTSRRLVLLALAALCRPALVAPSLAATAAATALDRFLAGLTTWSGDFTQTVVDGRGRKLGEGKGRLLISRPGKFRWELSPGDGPEAGQVLVADGRNLWFLDRDLEQVTVKPVTAALSQSPAMLLSGTGDVRAAFDVAADGRADGLEWVRVRPRGTDGDFRQARLAFRDLQLVRMELEDRLGQRTSLLFQNAVRNGPLAADELRFVPPAGADVIGTPLP
jgi:outer membrane lipoprotein carrier protein